MNFHLNIVVCMKCEHGDADHTCAGFCPCRKDPERRSINDHAEAGDCPLKLFTVGGSPNAPRVPAETLEQLGPKLWAELHARPLTLSDPAAEREWLASFTRRLPCGQCRSDWVRLIENAPPDLSSAHTYARWTWLSHNVVSVRLGKKPMDWAEAAAMYGWGR